MKRILVLLAMLLANTVSGECSTTFFPPLQPALPQNNEEQIQDTMSSASWRDNFTNPVKESYSNLAKIEQALFGKAYNSQNINSRLSRIEKTLFFTTYPNASNSQRIDNIISNFNQINKNPNISRNTLSKLESRIFNQSFSQNSAQRRIERLEEQVFGAAQSGELEARLKALQLASKSYNPNNTTEDDFTETYTTGDSDWRNILGNWGGGTMTGFTPSLNPYNNYNYRRYNPSYGRYNPSRNFNRYIGNHGLNKSIRTYRGYRDVFRSYGTGTGVTILD